MWGLCYLITGAVRGPERSGDIPSNQVFWEQRCQLYSRYPRLAESETV